MVNYPLITVVMSVYNGADHLSESIESILTQTFKDFEFIIINDGSTDRTQKIIDSYKDKRISVINQENCGLTKSLNTGISLSKGKYIARQDADDISKPERFERQVAFMEANPAVGLISSFYEMIDDKSKLIGLCKLSVEDGPIRAGLVEINQFCHGAAMMRKKALDDVGMYREFFKYAQDHDLWLRISEKHAVANIPEYLYCYRLSDNAISSRQLLRQSRYAGAAIIQARLRRQMGEDDLQNGFTPVLPALGELSSSLKKKILDFAERNRADMFLKKKYFRYLEGTFLYYRIKWTS